MYKSGRDNKNWLKLTQKENQNTAGNISVLLMFDEVLQRNHILRIIQYHIEKCRQ